MLSSHLAANPNVARSQRPLGSNPTDMNDFLTGLLSSVSCFYTLYSIIQEPAHNFLISFVFLQRTALPASTTLKNYSCLVTITNASKPATIVAIRLTRQLVHSGQMGSVPVGPLLRNWEKRAV